MAKLSFDEVKAQKNFYRDNYRRVITVLLFSFILSLILVVVIIYIYLTQSEPFFYATDGVKAPIQVAPLQHPNMSANYLLPPDPPDESVEQKMEEPGERKNGR